MVTKETVRTTAKMMVVVLEEEVELLEDVGEGEPDISAFIDTELYSNPS
jgi:hypothetical protein